MRNLKKFLALVMAMVMAFSLMLTVNAAHIGTQYTDEDDVTPAFEEAMEVLTGMGVYQGDPGATFRPASTITRAETAALIYRLATGDTTDARKDLYKDYGNFADVTSADWFAGYVGYCANAGYIKGKSATTFDPHGQVTGYEVLAMVLRAVGYDQNGEFTGPTWQTNVAALSTQLGILAQVKSTHYGDRLYEASRRDVVASLLFESAQIPMVTYTAIGGYNQYDNLLGSNKNPSLGVKLFGLTKQTGVIVGNQETGEKVTVLGVGGSQTYMDDSTPSVSKTASWTDYNYPDVVLVTGTAGGGNGTANGKDIVVPGNYFKFDTGIDEFGHKVTMWFDNRDNNNDKVGQTTYAMLDKVKKVALVFEDESTPNLANDFGKTAKKAGFTLNSNNTAIFNGAFEKFDVSKPGGGTNTPKAATGTDSPSDLYLLISNTTGDQLDVVIEMNIEASKITTVHNTGAEKLIGVPSKTPAYIVNANLVYPTYDSSLSTGIISQEAVVGNSTKALGDYEVGIHIDGTKAHTISENEKNAFRAFYSSDPAEDAWFKFVKPTTKEGVVSSFKQGTAGQPGTGKIVLSDGTTLEQSVMYGAVATGKTTTMIPQQGAVGSESYSAQTYRFYLDQYGKYIGAEPIFSTEFVYGTYLDFHTELGSSSYTYRLVGVDMNGEMITKDVQKYGKNVLFNNSSVKGIESGDGWQIDTDIAIPYRGNLSDATAQYGRVVAGNYKGFAVRGTTMVEKTTGETLAIPMEQGTNNLADTTILPRSNPSATGSVAVGAVSAGGDASKNPLYFTEKTKFVLVSGTGTDTQKTKVYNGISELLGTNSQVVITFDGTAGMPSYLNAGTNNWEMMWYSKSPFVYGQDASDTAYQVDTIFIPSYAVTFTGSNLYFVGDKTAQLVNADGENATKFTMWNNGEKGQYWVDGLIGTANTSAYVIGQAGHDKFYVLTNTGKTANDGEPIYRVTAATAGFVQGVYRSTTKDSNTAVINDGSNQYLYKVGGAVVGNPNKDYADLTANVPNWPGITDLTTLNEAGSLSYGGSLSRQLHVSAVLSADGLTAEYIYVDYTQD